MPSYGSLHSPSLSKLNGTFDMKGRMTGARRRTMSIDNILGDPFALATISIATVSPEGCHGAAVTGEKLAELRLTVPTTAGLVHCVHRLGHRDGAIR